MKNNIYAATLATIIVLAAAFDGSLNNSTEQGRFNTEVSRVSSVDGGAL